MKKFLLFLFLWYVFIPSFAGLINPQIVLRAECEKKAFVALFNKQNFAEAYKYLKEGSDEYKSALCQYYLAYLYMTGLYVKQDVSLGKMYILLAYDNARDDMLKKRTLETIRLINSGDFKVTSEQLRNFVRSFTYNEKDNKIYLRNGGGNMGGSINPIIGIDSSPSGGGSSRTTCSGCGGSGRCTGCNGRGTMSSSAYYTDNHTIISNCPSCGGSGRCGVCYGRGTL